MYVFPPPPRFSESSFGWILQWIKVRQSIDKLSFHLWPRENFLYFGRDLQIVFADDKVFVNSKKAIPEVPMYPGEELQYFTCPAKVRRPWGANKKYETIPALI